VAGRTYYEPSHHGAEQEVAGRMAARGGRAGAPDGDDEAGP
jgi:hypothetical protein